MKTNTGIKIICTVLILLSFEIGICQISPNVYLYEETKDSIVIMHELKIAESYMVYTKFKEDPAEFISTVGGFYTHESDSIKVKLEFNSNYENDVITSIHLPYSIVDSKLILDGLIFEAKTLDKQDLDGEWLFATRGPDTGQDRRGDANARKTLKFLINGRFQWIAYHTETFKFSGTGGGVFTSKDGIYIENIAYFSRDNKRVGASLSFNYERIGDDWHHTGKNSKGAPMYEIWARRN